ncbi:NME3 isoform 7, partial [Pan troglodytes]
IFANLFPAACTGAHERTFLAVKPDGVQRRLVGEIVRRFERKGFKRPDPSAGLRGAAA